ncbi:MAG: hypothetical protein IM537_18775 [Pseudanabaena sp. M57BS1SP1A06MG]|nr:hypothetical protein [Pseudanabaena sp. M34BS1SP1A06MG]MCA6602194.1 hypothetical protein [Pseudanabaena sp. M57BS1SP1A06MG]
MITLAGHGKDPRLVQAELPIVPNVGDRVRENLNTPNTNLKSLIREGIFLKTWERKGYKTQWMVSLDSSAVVPFDPDLSEIIERAAASVLVEESIPLEPELKVGDRVYQGNPDSIGTITKISRGKAVVSVSDRTVIVPLDRLNLCDPDYSPKPSKSLEEIQAEEEAAIAKARDEYLKSQIELPFDYDIPDNEKGNECYTPAYVLDLCRDFLGGFDLDPFSNAIAQRTVRAKIFWTKADNALTKDWSSFKRKWCNPPYRKLSSDGIIDKILSYAHIGETLLLVNSSTSAKWFHKCMDACTAYLHPNKRIPFYNPYSEIEYKNGKKRSGNEHDQTLFYFGDRPLEFAEALKSLGNAVQPIRKSTESSSFEIGQFVDTNHCGKNLEIIEIKGAILICKNSLGQQFGIDQKSCSHTLTYSVEHVHSLKQRRKQGKLKPLRQLTSAQMPKQSVEHTSLKQASTVISAITIHPKELTSLQVDSHAQELPIVEPEQDSITKNLDYGLNTSESLTKDNHVLQSLKIHQALSLQDYEQYLEDSEWSDIVGMIRKSCRLTGSEVPKKDPESLSLPTLTSNKGTKRSRPAGQSRCEKWLKDNGFLQSTQVLSAEMMCVLFGFPKDWTQCLSVAIATQKEESEVDTCLEDQSISTVQVLYSKESYFSTDNSEDFSYIEEANLANSDHAIATKPSKSVAISRMDEVLVGSLDDRLAQLHQERDRLIQSGASPKGIWIEWSKPAGKNFKQACWKSDKPRPEWGDKKTKYIGEWDKDAHKSAIAQYLAGKKLQEIEKEIKDLSK